MENENYTSASSILALFETSKQQRASFVQNIIDAINEGDADPIRVHVQIKAMENIIEQLTADVTYRSLLLSEVDKYGSKQFEAFGAKLSSDEVGVKYDYTQCGDNRLNELLQQQAILKSKIDERQKVLKTMPLSGMEILIEDELVKVYPPSKTSTTAVKTTLL